MKVQPRQLQSQGQLRYKAHRAVLADSNTDMASPTVAEHAVAFYGQQACIEL